MGLGRNREHHRRTSAFDDLLALSTHFQTSQLWGTQSLRALESAQRFLPTSPGGVLGRGSFKRSWRDLAQRCPRSSEAKTVTIPCTFYRSFTYLYCFHIIYIIQIHLTVAFTRYTGTNKAEFRLKIIKPHCIFMVAGMTRMQKCRSLPPHAAGRICPGLPAPLRSPPGAPLGKGRLSRAPHSSRRNTQQDKNYCWRYTTG